MSSTTEQAFNHGVLDGFTFQVLDLANTRNATQLLGKQSQVTMAISDEDDPSEPVALTNYGIRWHFPYENWRKDPNHTPFYTWLQQPIIDVQSPGTCGYNESIGFTFTYGNPFWVTVTNSAAKAFQIVGPIAGTEFSVLGALMEVIGVVLPDFGPKALATSASFNACWNDEHSIFPDGKSEPMHRYSMAPMKFAEYKIDPWKVDLYGSHGFVQVETKATQTYVGHKSVGMFTLAVLPSEGGTE